MEDGDEPAHGDEDHASAPTFERSSDRQAIVKEIRRSFDMQGRTFGTTRSSSKAVAYKCDGCNLTFGVSLCENKKSPLLGTWGLTKKAATQSWKVCPLFPLRLLRLALTTSCNHRRFCIIAQRVVHSNQASDEVNAFGKRGCLRFDQVVPQQGCSEEEC